MRSKLGLTTAALVLSLRPLAAQACPTGQPSRAVMRDEWVEPYPPAMVMAAFLTELTDLGYKFAVADTNGRRLTTEPSYFWPATVDYRAWSVKTHPGQLITVVVDTVATWSSVSVEVRLLCHTGEAVPTGYGPQSTVESFVAEHTYREVTSSVRRKHFSKAGAEVQGPRCAPLDDGDRKLRICRKLASAKKNDVDAQLDYALAQIRFFRVPDAREFADRALTLSNGTQSVYDSIGTALLKEKAFAEAERWYTGSVARWPDHAAFHRALGTALARQGKHQDAVGHFQRAVALAPSDHVSQFGAAMTLATLQRIPEATERCNAATPLYIAELRERPRDWNAWIALGRCAAISGQHALAVSYFERAAQIDFARIRTDADLVDAINRSIEIAGPQDAAPLPARP